MTPAYSRVHQDSNSQSGNSFGNARVHSLKLSFTFASMRCDSRASLLAYTLANPCFGRKPKARVATWNTFGARTSHEQTWTHKTHHSPHLGEATTFPLILFFVHGHWTNTQMSFCPGNPKLWILKFLKLGLLQFWRLITFCGNLRLRGCLNKHCNPRQDLSNSMWHATSTRGNQGNS